MARVVKSLGPGGQRRAARELGWDRETIRKGLHELASGCGCVHGYTGRGRKRAEARLPHWLEDLTDIVDGQSQTAALKTCSRLYTRLSAAQVRVQLVIQKGYSQAELPSQESIRVKLNGLGYRLRSVQKSVPKKIKETDAMFEPLAQVHEQARQDKTV